MAYFKEYKNGSLTTLTMIGNLVKTNLTHPTDPNKKPHGFITIVEESVEQRGDSSTRKDVVDYITVRVSGFTAERIAKALPGDRIIITNAKLGSSRDTQTGYTYMFVDTASASVQIEYRNSKHKENAPKQPMAQQPSEYESQRQHEPQQQTPQAQYNEPPMDFDDDIPF